MDAAECANIKAQFKYNEAQFENFKNMNTLLVEGWLSLLPLRIRNLYTQNQMVTNPNATYLEVFEYFLK